MNREEIIQFSAEFWQVEPSFIVENLKLDDKSLPNNSSIRFYQFMAKTEAHFNVRINDVNSIITFGDLFKDLENSS